MVWSTTNLFRRVISHPPRVWHTAPVAPTSAKRQMDRTTKEQEKPIITIIKKQLKNDWNNWDSVRGRRNNEDMNL